MAISIGLVFALGPALGLLARYLHRRKKYNQGNGDPPGVDKLESSEV